MRALLELSPLLFAAVVLAAPRTGLAQWAPDGRAISTADGAQVSPALVADGAGGAIIVWHDDRAAGPGLYAQRVLASGALDPGWPADGLALGAVGAWHSVCTDGAGGAIVAWHDFRSGQFTPDIYAQHVLATGTVDSDWPVGGRALCTAAYAQFRPVIVSDGAGGAIVAWDDSRSGAADIYAQHVMASGIVDPTWPTDGVALCTAAGAQAFPRIVPNDAGGAIVTWEDDRNYFTGSTDLYAHRVLASGNVDPAWPPDGVALCTAAGIQNQPAIVPDGAGGAIVAWRDTRSGDSDIYAGRVLVSGTVDPAWPADGVALCQLAGSSQAGPAIAPDGAGGAIVAWADGRNVDADVYAQRVLPSGTVDPVWPANGRRLTAATDHQAISTICSDGAGGAIVAWRDLRNGTRDVYAQRVLGSGDVDPAWPLDGAALCTADGTQEDAAIVSDGSGGAIVTWHDLRPGSVGYDIYAQRVTASGSVVAVAAGQAASPFRLLPPHPNPAGGGPSTIRFELPRPQRVRLDVYDLAGHRVRTLAREREFPAGVQTLSWDGRDDSGAALPGGLYFVRVRAGDREETCRAVRLH